MTDKLLQVLEHFTLAGPVATVEGYGSGHIHDTYLVACQAPVPHNKYILQKFNHKVFKSPKKVMENIHRVIRHIQEKPLSQIEPLQSLKIIPTHSGEQILQSNKDSYWRVFNFIDHTYAIDLVQHPSEALEAGLAFAHFFDLLRDMNARQLHHTIEDFHHVGKRFQQLEQAVMADSCQRVKDHQAEISFARSRKDRVDFLSELIDSATLPWRVTHNDTKINNVLFQEQSHIGISVVDLDTVMPGYLMYDFGDMARTFCNPVMEEDPIQGVQFRMEVFDALCEGFFRGLSQGIKPVEIDSLVHAPWLMTYIMGIRFLRDFLSGDIYYKISYPLHNLDRARNQFKLIEEIEKNQENITLAIHKWARAH